MSVNAVEIDPERSVRAYKLENTPSPSTKGIVVYTVNEVYIYIPAEHSAAGFELKIAGSVKITDKVCIQGYYKLKVVRNVLL